MLFTLPVFLNNIFFTAMIAIAGLSSCRHDNVKNETITGRAYFLNGSGNDANDGSKNKPWKTIAKLNNTKLNPGDTVCFAGGQIFTGSILLSAEDAGSADKPIIITSYNSGRATIDGAAGTAFTVYQSSFVHISQLNFSGAGRKTGNTKDGVIINLCSNITVDGIDVKGFQKSGLLINSSSAIQVKNVYATENGFSGIYAVGEWNKKNCSDILITHCKAENNPGDPTSFTNHSGNGILAGYCKNVTIEYCSATNNGWDMPRKGNGPVGIWCFEADSVTIQHCISYKNRTAPGAADGGGFDLDGGVTNSVIQYCLSYENEGSGYGIFQYAGAANWNNNTIRYCISENDGSVSPAHAGVFIWNSSDDSSQFTNSFFYNNTIYNTKGAAISYEALSKNAGFRFYNNLFIARDSLVIGKETNSTYLGNNWYSLNGQFLIAPFTHFDTWANTTNKEKYNNRLVGFNIDPLFPNAGHTTLANPDLLNSFTNYQLPTSSPLQNSGLDLKQLFKIDNGGKTFNGTAAGVKGIGACN